MNFELAPRNVTEAIPAKELIRSGDMFCILRLDGLDPIILWGTGCTEVSLIAIILYIERIFAMSLCLTNIYTIHDTGTHCGHTVVAVWYEEELYILESQVKSNYWPKDLIQVCAAATTVFVIVYTYEMIRC